MKTIRDREFPVDHQDGAADGPRRGDELSSTSSGDGQFLRRLTIGLVGAAAAFYLLRALGEFLRPVLVAVLLVYAIWPLHAWLKRGMRPGLSLLIIGSGLGLVSLLIGWLAFANAGDIGKDVPKYEARAGRLAGQLRDRVETYLPQSVRERIGHTDPVRIPLERMGQSLQNLFGVFSGFVAWAGLVGLYVVFIVLEADRFPGAIRRAFPADRAARILEVMGSINEAVIEYLSVKVKVNLLVAIPAGLLMLAFGVPGAVLWAVLTFLARFIPYLGGIIAFALPVATAVVQFESPVRAGLFAAALLAIHLVGEYAIEPVMTGKAVGLSPLVVLLALAFWELTWGIVGMILAIPLTVILKIALERLDRTRPLARLLAE